MIFASRHIEGSAEGEGVDFSMRTLLEAEQRENETRGLGKKDVEK